MTDRELMQQALEALEQSVSTCFDQYSHHEVMSRPEHFMNRAMKALRERLARPEQEPVAWEEVLGAIARGWTHEDNKHKTMDVPLAVAIAKEVQDMIAAQQPREWVGLSDVNAVELWQLARHDIVEFARVIEAKLKEKNA